MGQLPIPKTDSQLKVGSVFTLKTNLYRKALGKKKSSGSDPNFQTQLPNVMSVNKFPFRTQSSVGIVGTQHLSASGPEEPMALLQMA